MSLESRRLAETLRASRAFIGVAESSLAPRDAGLADGQRPFVLGRSILGGDDVVTGEGGTFILGTSWLGRPDVLGSAAVQRPFILGFSWLGGNDILTTIEE